MSNELLEAAAAKLCGMKTVGRRTRSEFEADPIKAWHRGFALDATLQAARPRYPRGVWRLTHLQMNQLDLARQVGQAAKVNQRRA